MLTSIWVNDIEIKLIEDYKSAEEVIVNEKVKYVFIDSLSETIDESEIIKRGVKTLDLMSIL